MKNQLTRRVGEAGIIGMLLVLLLLNLVAGTHWLDSDMAAEMMFSKLLAEEGHLFGSTHWYYSTEFRVLYTQVIMTPLFHIFGSWHVIRVLTNMICYLLLLLSYWYMMVPLKLKRSSVLLGGVAVLMPFSETLMLHMHMGNTYMPHVILMFFYLGALLRLRKAERVREEKPALIVVSVLSLVFGLSGVRYFMLLLAPILLAFLWQIWRTRGEMLKADTTKCKVRSFGISLVAALLGYGIHATVITKAFQFQTYDVTTFIQVFQGYFLDRVQNAFGALLMILGYIPKANVLSPRGIFGLFSFLLLLILILVRRGLQAKLADMSEERRFLVFFWDALVFVNLFLFVFTDTTMVPRYYIPIWAFTIVLFVLYLEMAEDGFEKKVLLYGAGIMVLLGTVKEAASLVTTDKNQDRMGAISFLQDHDYHFGYATYWNGNIMEELSDGAVEVAALEDLEEKNLFRWSSKTVYFDPNYYEGPVFLLTTLAETNAHVEDSLLQKGQEVYRDASFVIYSYEDQKSFLEILNEKVAE